MFTLLSQLFVTERHRLRAGYVGHAMPLASEIDVDDHSIEPLLITTTRGTFLESWVSRAGYARFGFSECPIEEEATLIREFHRVLVARSRVNGWGCVAATVGDALTLMRGRGANPCHVVAGPWLNAMGNLKVLDAGFPEGAALLLPEPSAAGLHTRVGDYVGILAYRVDRCFAAVFP